MTSKVAVKGTAVGAVLTLALTVLASVVAVAPAHAVCSAAYFSVNTAAQATVKVPNDCTGTSEVRARKYWYYTDSTNSTVGSSVGPWINKSYQGSVVFLPSGRFHKQNVIESN